MCGFIGYISHINSKKNVDYQNKFNLFFNKQKYRGPDFNQKILINKKIFKFVWVLIDFQFKINQRMETKFSKTKDLFFCLMVKS